jgi:HEAT repeats
VWNDEGSPPGQEEHGKYKAWDCTGAYLLAFGLPRKSLLLTGKKPAAISPLNRAEVDEVISAGRDAGPRGSGSGYANRTVGELQAGLSSWSPAVRKRSARELASREGDFVPALLELLAGSSRDSRYGACEALAQLGPRADPAASQLRALLKDPDPWLQSLACLALPALGEEQRKASVSDLLAMAARENPADPRRMAQRDATIALFAPYPGKREPKSILAASLEGVDRELLYPAIRSVLENDDGAARGALKKSYDQLTEDDLAELLPAIVRAVERMAPSNEMFADGIRLAGLDLLSRLHIREGMALCVAVMEPDRWGQGNRIPKCLEYLGRYGTHARQYLPQLKDMRRQALERNGGKGQADRVQLLDRAISAIETGSAAPTLLDLEEFCSRSPRNPAP